MTPIMPFPSSPAPAQPPLFPHLAPPPPAAATPAARPPMQVAGLFSGIGGFELGLSAAGHHPVLLCESWAPARAVLQTRFPGMPVEPDVCALESLPPGVDLLTAGFPCQDLSQAGMTAGLAGERSGLVYEVFRLLARDRVPWVLIENVPFMLHLRRGEALSVIVDTLEALGYRWAYRVVNTRSFGLPQRRERVFLLASNVGDPRTVLLSDDAGAPAEPPLDEWRRYACGFYWTEGRGGLGWASDAVPTLKGGSTIGIPSSPAIVLPSGDIVTPDIRDAERMQGFAPDWTDPARAVDRGRHRWKLVGNAVTVDVIRWIGERLREPRSFDPARSVPLVRRRGWPPCAWGSATDGRWEAPVSAFPVPPERPAPLAEFLREPTRPLSTKATAGFYRRATAGSLRFPPGFLDVVRSHLERSEAAAAK